MDGGKKVVIAVVLILIIIAAVVWQLKRTGAIGGAKMPDYVLDRKYWKIDNKTLESVELSLREWRSLGHDEHRRYKNPKTGTYTMVDRMRCGSCGEWIPVPESPALSPKPGGPGTEQDPALQAEKIRNEYICPRCGKHAFVRFGPGAPPPPPPPRR